MRYYTVGGFRSITEAVNYCNGLDDIVLVQVIADKDGSYTTICLII